MTAVSREEALRLTAKAMSEADLLANVIEMAHTYGWLVAHFRPARTEKGWRTAVQGDKGFPDLCLARYGKVLIVELKAEKGKTTPEQANWLYEVGADHGGYIWKPSDWLSGEIEAVLR